MTGAGARGSVLIGAGDGVGEYPFTCCWGLGEYPLTGAGEGGGGLYPLTGAEGGGGLYPLTGAGACCIGAGGGGLYPLTAAGLCVVGGGGALPLTGADGGEPLTAGGRGTGASGTGA